MPNSIVVGSLQAHC